MGSEDWGGEGGEEDRGGVGGWGGLVRKVVVVVGGP